MFDDREERYNKKIRRLAFRSAWAAGIGIGALIVRLIAPLLLGDDKTTSALLAGAGFILAGGAALNFAAIMFFRKQAVLLGSLVSWLIVPGLLVRLWMKTMM